jgi:endonuclease/exonuclease/phosphatase (EEP) superfamily protein YafD
LPTVVAGDFNERSEEDALQFLASRGLTNAKHAFAHGAPTWRWKTSIGSVSSEFDHIVADPSLEPVDAWVVRKGRSDHYPVVAVFQLARR